MSVLLPNSFFATCVPPVEDGNFVQVLTYPQMPVLRIAIVTSPCFNSVPDLTLSALGPASLIQRSCLGFVKTPMLGFNDAVSPTLRGTLILAGMVDV